MALHGATLDEALDIYLDLEQEKPGPGILAALGLVDRYWLMVRMLGRYDDMVERRRPEAAAWLYARCREVEADPDGYLDLWAREHGKSSVQTVAGTIQDILRDPEITVGLFSHTKGHAKKFLAEIKREFETNRNLIILYPDVLYANPTREAQKWSEDDGLIVKRKGNPKEATIEAWGLVDGQPIGRHFWLRMYDDVVVEDSVSPVMVEKTTKMWQLSNNLGMEGGWERYVGTRYSFGDTYQVMMDRGAVKTRIYPATHDGTITGRPVLFTQEYWESKKISQADTLASQLLLNPAATGEIIFPLSAFHTFFVRPRTLNVYILVDPSAGRKTDADNTAMAVIGIDAQANLWLLDGYAHRMSLGERWRNLSNLVWKWRRTRGVQNVSVHYEEYGHQTDVEHFELEMLRLKPEMQFAIDVVNWPHEGDHAKDDRIKRLVPDLKSGRFRLPAVVAHEVHGQALWRADGQQIAHDPIEAEPKEWREARDRGDDDLIQQPIRRVLGIDAGKAASARTEFGSAKRRQGYETAKLYDLTRTFLGEVQYFPANRAKRDLIDAASRIYDAKPVPPVVLRASALLPSHHIDT